MRSRAGHRRPRNALASRVLLSHVGQRENSEPNQYPLTTDAARAIGVRSDPNYPQARGRRGTGVFSNDTAADVRDDWRELLLEGLDPQEATKRLMERYREVLQRL